MVAEGPSSPGRRWRISVLAVLSLSCAACVRVNVQGDRAAWAESMSVQSPLRVATYNTSLYADDDGGLVRRLRDGQDQGAKKIAAVLQRVRPDLVLLNEFDYDAAGAAADLFQHAYLEMRQAGGGGALSYRYRYLAPVNTGVQSGLDLDNNGTIGGDGRDRGNDAWGFGLHPGQYGMLVLSRYPIDVAAVRTFQLLKWSAMPGARKPIDPTTGKPWYPADVWSQLRLSSKSHWDVPVHAPQGIVHFLVSHPTPPVFDGPEDRNGARNHDEIRLWSDYISPGDKSWLCDDDGHCGGLPADAAFVIAGDLNNDPADGAGAHEAIVELLEHPRVLRHATPRSEGAAQAGRTGEGNAKHRGSAAHDTGSFGAKVGNLRLDYVLPSQGFTPVASGVFWPPADDADAAIADGSDHRLVWLDLLR